MASSEMVLVVVHPGSACGSADMNLGRSDAQCARDDLVVLLDAWEGPLVVIDGELSDELPAYRDLQHALLAALKRAQDQGFVAQRIWGDDGSEEDQHVAMDRLLAQHNWKPHAVEFSVTGAWLEVDTGGGCVGGIVAHLRKKSFLAYPNEHVVAITSEFDLAEEEDLLALTRPAEARLPAPPGPTAPRARRRP